MALANIGNGVAKGASLGTQSGGLKSGSAAAGAAKMGASMHHHALSGGQFGNALGVPGAAGLATYTAHYSGHGVSAVGHDIGGRL